MSLKKAAIDPFPPMLSLILGINIVVFLLANMFPEVKTFTYDHLASYYVFSNDFKVCQTITHLFLHTSFTHLFYNMFILWIFGMVLENVWGKWNFLIFYMVCGMGAWGLHQIMNWIVYNDLYQLYVQFLTYQSYENFIEVAKLLPQQHHYILINTYEENPSLAIKAISLLVDTFKNTPTIGASGAVFGVLAAFGLLFGETLLYAYFVFPIKAKWFVAFFILLEVIAVMSVGNDNVAHYAHIGGAITSILLILLFKKQFGKNKII
jgi:membrane associated rhomboid family serine protease